MLFAFVILSLLVTTIALFMGITAPKEKDQTNEGDSKTKDETPDVWMLLGLADDAPNVIRAVVAGPSGKGSIVNYINYRKRWNPNTGLFESLGVGDPYPEEKDDQPFGSIKKLIREKTGKRVYGLPFFNSLKPITVDRVVQVDTNTIQTIKQDTSTPAVVRMLSAKTVKRFGLYEEIIRPTLHIDVDTKDGTRFSVVSTLMIWIADPRPGFEKYPDSLLQNVSEIVQNFFSSKVIKMTYEEYISMGDHGHKFDRAILNDLELLLAPLGARINQFTVSDPELNKSVQDARNQRSSATTRAETRRIIAQGDADAREIEGGGEAKYITKLAVANKARFEQLVTYYKEQGMDSVRATEVANSVILGQANAGPFGNLATYVAPGGTAHGGGVVQPTLPVAPPPPPQIEKDKPKEKEKGHKK